MKRILYLIIIVFFLSSCYSIKPDRIAYNEEAEIYEYRINKTHSIKLRDSNNNLVSKSNYNSFYQELYKSNYKYPILKQVEKAYLLNNDDIKFTSLYSDANQYILDSNYKSALKNINSSKIIYPDLSYYSDVLFLEAYCYEKLDCTGVNYKYSEFLKLSNGKYSRKFRGHRDDDISNELWFEQRRYAKVYLLDNKPTFSKTNFKTLNPKYYYCSFMPGFNQNPEDILKGGKGNLFKFSVGMDFNKLYSFGLQTYHNLYKGVYINPRIFISEGVYGAKVALPIQVYQSSKNHLGIKLSPFISFNSIVTMKYQGIRYLINEGVFNTGARMSFGYYFSQNLSLGASYQYHLFNENNHLELDKSNVEIFWGNEYDLSLYYNIFKGFCIKMGTKQDGIVSSFFWKGLEMGYNINTNEFVFTSTLF